VKDTPLHCRHFGDCGGCSALDVPYQEQLQAKVATVMEHLQPFAPPGLEPTHDTPPKTPRHDRIDLLYPVHAHRDGLTMGLYQRGTHRIEEIEECRIQAQALTVLGREALQTFRRHGIPPYREQREEGVLRAFRARYMPGTGQLLLGIITTATPVRRREELATELLDATEGLRDPSGRPLECVGVVRNIQDEAGNALIGRLSTPILGEPWQWDRVRVGGLEIALRVSFASFYQSNRHAAKLLYDRALEMLGGEAGVGGCHVVDGYGGVGAFGVRMLAAGADRVDVIESHPEACEDAIENARQLGGGMNVVVCPFPETTFEGEPEIMIVDPPRKGLGEDGVAAVLRARPERLLHVACSTKSLARDLAGLTAAGYGLRRVHVADLFPHTEHVEVLALLERGP